MSLGKWCSPPPFMVLHNHTKRKINKTVAILKQYILFIFFQWFDIHYQWCNLYLKITLGKRFSEVWVHIGNPHPLGCDHIEIYGIRYMVFAIRYSLYVIGALASDIGYSTWPCLVFLRWWNWTLQMKIWLYRRRAWPTHVSRRWGGTWKIN